MSNVPTPGQAAAPAPAAAPTGAAPAPGAPPPAAPAAAASGAEPLSPKIQAMMKREADLVKRDRALKADLAKLESDRAATAAERAKYQAFEDSWKTDPLKAIEGRGIDPLQLAIAKASGSGVTPEMRITLLHQEIQALSKRIEEGQTKSQEEKIAQVKDEEAENVNAFKAEIAAHVDSAAEKYPLTHAYQRADLVFATIDDHYQKTLKDEGVGEELGIERASELVEARLREGYDKARGLIEKRQADEAVKSATPPPGAVRRSEPESPRWVEKPVKTLAGIQASAPSVAPNRYLSDEERLANAFARLRAANRR